MESLRDLCVLLVAGYPPDFQNQGLCLISCFCAMRIAEMNVQLLCPWPSSSPTMQPKLLENT